VDVSTGLVVVVVALVAALVAGLLLMWRDGRFRGTHAVRGASAATGQPPVSVLEGTPWEGQLGERATLLQFSSAFCAPCRATRRILADVAGVVPGVAHVEIDAEHHLALVRRVGVLRTPTTLVLDAAGREASRASGAPRREQVLAALSAAVSD
jgi:thiol-disulfide isomerase/thioredoxin